MENNRIIGIVSAYGAMTESDNRYRVLIHAESGEEFNAKFKAFMLGETVRAMTTPEISHDLGTVDAKKVFEALAQFTFPEGEGERTILTVPELCTDYHIENPEIPAKASPEDDFSAWREAIVMADYGMECCGPSEFPSVVAIYDPVSEKDEDGNPVLAEYTDYHHGTIRMTPSELSSFLLGWERQVIPVM